jgi:aminoglycoside phosphotransferase (APT) family kinase protein
VYRARDSRLGRTVAVKVVRGEYNERFEREARAISALNHPHICTLHDVGSQDGVNYLVMELVDGETLADRLHKGPLPQDQALRIAIEMAGRRHRPAAVHPERWRARRTSGVPRHPGQRKIRHAGRGTEPDRPDVRALLALGRRWRISPSTLRQWGLRTIAATLL